VTTEDIREKLQAIVSRKAWTRVWWASVPIGI
jgi:hypothetical protein